MPARRSATARPDAQIRRWIARELAAAPPRAPSLIITVWGDAIAPHGGAVMLPGLIRLLAPFGINERRVRTSVFRLAREGWLEARPSDAAASIGSPATARAASSRRTAASTRRPTSAGTTPGSSSSLAGLAATQRRALREELGWEGFGTLAPGVFARPAADPLDGAADRRGAGRGEPDHHGARARRRRRSAAGRSRRPCRGRGISPTSPPTTAASCGASARVIDRFRATGDGEHDPEQCFIVRTLLIHAYRRVLLRDPQLPAALLPLDWPGAAAYALCRDFYRLTHRSAERHLVAVLEGAHGRLPRANAAFYGASADSKADFRFARKPDDATGESSAPRGPSTK